MPLHLVKLCVGADSVGDLERWVEEKSKANERAGLGRIHDHVTRMHPQREKELLDGGSIYWVIKGVVLVRQQIKAFEKRLGSDGVERCAILLEPKLILTEPQPRRAFRAGAILNLETRQRISKTERRIARRRNSALSSRSWVFCDSDESLVKCGFCQWKYDYWPCDMRRL